MNGWGCRAKGRKSMGSKGLYVSMKWVVNLLVPCGVPNSI